MKSTFNFYKSVLKSKSIPVSASSKHVTCKFFFGFRVRVAFSEMLSRFRESRNGSEDSKSFISFSIFGWASIPEKFRLRSVKALWIEDNEEKIELAPWKPDKWLKNKCLYLVMIKLKRIVRRNVVVTRCICDLVLERVCVLSLFWNVFGASLHSLFLKQFQVVIRWARLFACFFCILNLQPF